MKNLKTYIVALLIIITSISFAQKITINNNKEGNVFLQVKEVEIALKEQVFSKTTDKSTVNFILNDDVPNVIANVQSDLKFLFKNVNSKDLSIKIIKLNDNNSIQQNINSFNNLENEINFKSKNTKENYIITIPKIEKGTYAIIVNNSTTCNVFEIN
ncbi:MAG TPA: hypothetical protein EYG89_03540 [Bacteroidia bacterium]|nr:hypothetical protein [Bacteroidia bacterium]